MSHANDGPRCDTAPRTILWARLPDQRPKRELFWLSLMPNTEVTEVGSPRTHPPESGIEWIDRSFRRPVSRFVEAGAFGWLRDLSSVDPRPFQWVASLELCALVTGQLSAYAARHGIRQVVVTWENMSHQPLYRIPPYAQATRRALGADLMLCPIEAARDHLLALDYPAERIHVVAPGVDHHRLRPAEELGVHKVGGQIAFVSPVAGNKGVDRVLQAFDLVRRSEPEARLVVAGAGPLVGLVREAEQRTGGAVRYLGTRSPAEIAELLATSDVFVTAPRATWKWNEQFGLAYLEAMAAGIPIVTTACGTNHEAVRPPNLRVEDTPSALAEGLLHFLRDDGARADVGAANRRTVLERHDMTTQAAAMAAAFDAVESLPLRARRPGGRAR
ncbi:glycosyltransferase family 4 protein [Knoellia locipacati]|uniref:glycosyltransferase family 4 protein n=1 Tax=Knoellia locipacati TaxID=882824 RepID=UPI00384B6F93